MRTEIQDRQGTLAQDKGTYLLVNGVRRTGQPLQIYRALRKAALEGNPAPTFDLLAEISGTTYSGACRITNLLATEGAYEIEEKKQTILGKQCRVRRYFFPDDKATSWATNERGRDKDARIRPCLNCNQEFESKWIGNRLCSTCGKRS